MNLINTSSQALTPFTFQEAIFKFHSLPFDGFLNSSASYLVSASFVSTSDSSESTSFFFSFFLDLVVSSFAFEVVADAAAAASSTSLLFSFEESSLLAGDSA